MSKRKRGRPPAKERVIGPDELEQIGDWMAEGRSFRSMARELGCDVSTVSRAVERQLLPALRVPKFRGPEAFINAYEHFYKRCWECFNDGAPAEIRKSIKEQLASRDSEDGDQFERTMTEVLRPRRLEWLKLAFEVKKELAAFLRYKTDSTINILQFDTPQEEFRIAGASVAQIDEQIKGRLVQLIRDRRQYELALEEQGLLPEQLSDGNTIEADNDR